MGKHANSKALTALGATLLVLIIGAAVTAIPSMVLSDSGKP
jgi:hypothetical protein